jgi:hypothetical protein
MGEASLNAAITHLAWSADDSRFAIATASGEVAVFKFSQA